MDVDRLYRQLQALNEPRGYFFNSDERATRFLLQGLITNRERYGYMCCPCRPAREDRDADSDIICPCAYRDDDIREYGSCYCSLYVSEAWNDGLMEKVYVPERRPPEKC